MILRILKSTYLWNLIFNLIDLFRIFDIEGKGFVTFDEFKLGLTIFHLFPTTDDAFLLFTRYETSEPGILRYSEFCDIFWPKTEEYSASLSNRSSYYIHKPYYKITEYFHPETRGAIEVLLGTNLHVESIAETMRQRLSMIPGFNIMDAFNTCDMVNDGNINVKQFKLLLESHGIKCDAKKVEGLIDRFDKTKDGKVTYTEFVDEVRPRSPLRRVPY